MENKIFLSSDGASFYTAYVWDMQSDDGCNCKGFAYRRKCRHVDELKKQLKTNNK